MLQMSLAHIEQAAHLREHCSTLLFITHVCLAPTQQGVDHEATQTLMNDGVDVVTLWHRVREVTGFEYGRHEISQLYEPHAAAMGK
jgi:hypothetical protein